MKGDQHYGGGKTPPTGNFFRCGKKGCIRHLCTKTKKEDGTPVNTDKVAAEMLAKAKAEGEARRAKWAVPGTTPGTVSPGTTEGTQMFIGGTVVPTFDELVSMEADNEGYCHTTYAFYQNEIQVDITACVDHAYNQSHLRLDRFDVLCDNQSTSHVIVEQLFVRNVRTCKWTLVLKTQAGVCRIDQIADLPGVGTVWFYPEGVANIFP